MEVELTHGTIKAIIDPQGAYLTNLSDEDGDILFPKRTLAAADGSLKIRGGCHVCLPNFGPGGNSGLAQHGFGRTSTWELSDKTDSSVLLTLREGEGDYRDLMSVVTYQLANNHVMMTCELTNNGAKPLRVAPAFHPYFAILGDGDVVLDDKKQSLDELGEAQFFAGDSHKLELPKRRMTLSSQGLPVWAKWTDQLGKYICIEPSQNGFAFLNDTPPDSELLAPEQSKTYSAAITWA